MNVQYKTNNIYILVTLAKMTAYHTKWKIKWMAITITSNKLLPEIVFHNIANELSELQVVLKLRVVTIPLNGNSNFNDHSKRLF